jgi:hypothetical protein
MDPSAKNNNPPGALVVLGNHTWQTDVQVDVVLDGQRRVGWSIVLSGS